MYIQSKKKKKKYHLDIFGKLEKKKKKGIHVKLESYEELDILRSP